MSILIFRILIPIDIFNKSWFNLPSRLLLIYIHTFSDCFISNIHKNDCQQNYLNTLRQSNIQVHTN